MGIWRFVCHTEKENVSASLGAQNQQNFLFCRKQGIFSVKLTDEGEGGAILFHFWNFYLKYFGPWIDALKNSGIKFDFKA